MNLQENEQYQPLYGKRILLGVTGGIAAYKSAELLRLYKKAGAQVQVVMTSAAQAFVQPLTFQALSGNPVKTDLLDETAEAAMGHIELARWADLLIIAPCSADFMAKLAQGSGDDLLSTVCLASAKPIAIAPAMNQQMWNNDSTQINLEVIAKQKKLIWGPAAGEQACGEFGLGRMEEPQALFEKTLNFFELTPQLKGINVMVTAGPTQEPIDPVRFIANSSSGKMGYALCEVLKSQGANITLISGPVHLKSPVAACVQVQTAEEMYHEVMQRLPQTDIFIGCAAVSDYRVKKVATQKIKKSNEQLVLTLLKNPDIIKEVAKHKNRPQFVVGFAAETEDLKEFALQKLKEKKLDMICGNDVSADNSGFASDFNKMELFIKDNEGVQQQSIPLQEKDRVAQSIVDAIKKYFIPTRL